MVGTSAQRGATFEGRFLHCL
nr:unnamed protein product [Callosobruchus chinensis]